MNKDDFIKEYFPEVECGREPCGNKITVQLMLCRKKRGSFILPTDTRDINRQVTAIGRVVKVGGISYRDRATGESWKEGAWADIGDVVIVHRSGGFNRISVPMPDDADEVVDFVTYNDFDVMDKVTGNYDLYSRLL